MKRQYFLFLVTVLLFANCAVAQQQEATRPITGEAVEKFAAFDPVIEKHMDHIGATAASFAVQHNGKIVYSRAYGWADKDQKVPATTETTFRIASNTKPITAAIMRQLVVRHKKLKLTTKVIPFLGIEPAGELGDERLNEITIEHLLTHKGGWDRATTFDPMFRPKTISKFHSINVADLTKEHIVSYMLTKPLQLEPGTKKAYSNFGYLLVGMMIEKVAEKKYSQVVEEFAEKTGVSVRLSATKVDARHSTEVFYPRESGLVMSLRDSLGGLTANAESMCRVMKKYWTSGKRRKKREKKSLMHYGRHPGSTNALMVYRTDGIDYVLILNATRDKGYKDDISEIRDQLDRVVESISNRNR